MNSYKLENKSLDESFLSGNTVLCDAAVREAELASVAEGRSIVVVLSNGKKYLGTIGKFHFKLERGIAAGKLEITRAKK